MDALDEYLESLAGLGSTLERGSFSLAQGELWPRLRKSIPDGRGALRFLLRWLHARETRSIQLDSRRGSFTVSASLDEVPHPSDLDFSGRDLDLARALIGAEQLASARWSLELDNGVSRCSQQTSAVGSWQPLDTFGRREVVAKFSGISSLVSAWAGETAKAFRHSPIPITWNQTMLSGPYSFTFPVLAWRHLRRKNPGGAAPLTVKPPVESLESYRTIRHESADIALALSAGRLTDPTFELLRDGELLPLTGVPHELIGLGGVLQSERISTDLGGDRIVNSHELQKLLATFRDEALDMALQLYNRKEALTPEQADGGFLGLQSILLHLLDQQRFTEGHLLAEWLGPSLQRGKVLQQFRFGYTFDRLRSLLAEPAGHPQTALRWHKQAEARIREQTGFDRSIVEEALLINARLELRARRDNPRGLSGDLHGRLLRLAHQLKARREYRRSASIFLLLGHSFHPGHPERLEHLIEAAHCCEEPPYTTALAEEKALGREEDRE